MTIAYPKPAPRMWVRRSRFERSTAFTLIELLVAVAIIGILIAILVPSFKAVSTSAKRVSTQARIAVLERGLESFRGETALGGSYPPSQGDQLSDPNGGGNNTLLNVRNPLPAAAGTMDYVDPIAGANLLVYGLVGADQLGTPGFPDLNNSGFLWDDQHSSLTPVAGFFGAYSLDDSSDAMLPRTPRYPGGGGSFVDEPTRTGIRSLKQLKDTGIVIPTSVADLHGTANQPYFTDAWERPIIYYRANRGATHMVTEPGDHLGSYDQRDNAFVTGTAVSIDIPPGLQGFDFGQGAADPDGPYYSRIGRLINNASPDARETIIQSAQYELTFDQFIHDKSVKTRNVAVNKDRFLLISAGADAIYGSSDDVVNWTRE